MVLGNLLMTYKMKITDTHVYFLTGPFSQWHESSFVVTDDGVERKYNCAEQYMMARKAALFQDQETHDRIMKVQPVRGRRFIEVPKEQKALGREVKNFDLKVWTEGVARGIVYKGNVAKFSQNADMKKYLLDTENRFLVEGASYDRVWGVGIDWNNPLILDEKNWKGTNWLGLTLMDVRTFLVDRANGNN